MRIIVQSYHTHAFPGCDQGCNADDETDRRQNPPTTACITNSNKNCTNEATNYTCNTKTTGEDYTGSVTITNGPPNEVWVSLMA